ncbi:MAG: hypothetical protein JST94_08645 [Bacteroidetes bacterium]|nr:hypothetical protein [Bacteroidota bacterium]MBS1671505.1 hypothetical protein [Bacteroidota bacterium]
MSTLDIQVYELLKSRFTDKEASLIIEYFDTKAEEKINQKKDIFLVKEDKVDMIKWMFIFSVSQLAATFAFLKFLK